MEPAITNTIPGMFDDRNRGKLTDFKCQIDPQPENRLDLVLGLAATLVGFRRDAGRPMGDDDRRFHLIAMLSTRSRTTGAAGTAPG